jgi:glucokinase
MYGIGIDLGGTFTKVALVGREGDAVASRTIDTLAGRSAREGFAWLASELKEMAGAAGLAWPPPDGCGIGIPGVLDHERGVLRFSGPLGWRDTEVGAIAGEALGCRVAIDTDVNAGALADLHLGCARDSTDMLYVSWGTGIGAGLVIARRLYHTRGGAMCNLGHMTADPDSRRLCYCGCRGCLEIEAGGKAMSDQARERIAAGETSSLSDVEVTPEAIAIAASSGDPLAGAILERSARLMARVLGSVLSLLNPDTVVFGGGVSRCFPVIQGAFDDELRARTPNFSYHLTVIRHSQFGGSAGVLGSAMLAMRAGN